MLYVRQQWNAVHTKTTYYDTTTSGDAMGSWVDNPAWVWPPDGHRYEVEWTEPIALDYERQIIGVFLDVFRPLGIGVTLRSIQSHLPVDEQDAYYTDSDPAEWILLTNATFGTWDGGEQRTREFTLMRAFGALGFEETWSDGPARIAERTPKLSLAQDWYALGAWKRSHWGGVRWSREALTPSPKAAQPGERRMDGSSFTLLALALVACGCAPPTPTASIGPAVGSEGTGVAAVASPPASATIAPASPSEPPAALAGPPAMPADPALGRFALRARLNSTDPEIPRNCNGSVASMAAPTGAGAAPDEAWFVGDCGVRLRHRNGSFELFAGQRLPRSVSRVGLHYDCPPWPVFSSVVAPDATEVMVVGGYFCAEFSDGERDHPLEIFDGRRWRRQPTLPGGSGALFVGAHGLWLIHDYGAVGQAIERREGGRWKRLRASLTEAQVADLTKVSDVEFYTSLLEAQDGTVWVVGGKSPDVAACWRYDGARWSEQSVGGTRLRRIVQAPDGSLWTVGSQLWRWDGSQWTAQLPGDKWQVWDVGPRSANDVWVAASWDGVHDARVLHHDGSRWVEVPARELPDEFHPQSLALSRDTVWATSPGQHTLGRDTIWSLQRPGDPDAPAPVELTLPAGTMGPLAAP